MDERRHGRSDNARLPEGVYTGKDNGKMIFSSRIRPQCRVRCADNLRKIREERLQENQPRSEEGEEIQYYDSVGALALDRCWEERGHAKVGFLSELFDSDEFLARHICQAIGKQRHSEPDCPAIHGDG